MTMFVFCHFDLFPACFCLAESIKTPRCELYPADIKQIVLCIICLLSASLSDNKKRILLPYRNYMKNHDLFESFDSRTGAFIVILTNHVLCERFSRLFGV